MKNDFSNEDLEFIIRDLKADLDNPNITPKQRETFLRMMRAYEKQLEKQGLGAEEKRLRTIVPQPFKRGKRPRRR